MRPGDRRARRHRRPGWQRTGRPVSARADAGTLHVLSGSSQTRYPRGVFDVAVIGCSTAGAASALFLARAGHRVTVFEAVAEPGPVGAGIMLQPTGMKVLADLRLFDRLRARGARVDRLHCVTARGRDIVDLAYRDVHPRAYGLGMHRGVLFAELFAAVEAERNVRLLCGHSIEGLRSVGKQR